MAYRLGINGKQLILYRNGKQSELHMRKFNDTKIYEWVKSKVLHAPKHQINEMLHAVGIFVKRKVKYGRKGISKTASQTKKVREIPAVVDGTQRTHKAVKYKPRGTVFKPGEY